MINDGNGREYQFPVTIFTAKSKLKHQADHVFSEVIEATHAHDSGDHAHAVEELWDVIQSAETMLRMYEADGHDVWAVRDAVEEKNRKRGYYHFADVSKM